MTETKQDDDGQLGPATDEVAESAPIWLRMGDADRAKYGGPEWVVFDVGRLFHMPSSELEALEARMPVKLIRVIYDLYTFSSISTRAALFTGRMLAGVKVGDPPRDEMWHEFNPATLQVQRREKPPNTTPPEASNGGRAARGKDKAQPETSPLGLVGGELAKS